MKLLAFDKIYNQDFVHYQTTPAKNSYSNNNCALDLVFFILINYNFVIKQS